MCCCKVGFVVSAASGTSVMVVCIGFVVAVVVTGSAQLDLGGCVWGGVDCLEGVLDVGSSVGILKWCC